MQLLNILGTKNTIRVLRMLIKHHDWEFNITELSKDSGINKGVLSRLISKLEKDNLIKINRKGKIKLLRINKENALIKNIIIPLFKKEEYFTNEYIANIIKNIPKKNISSIVLYGSFSSGDSNLASDIDLLIIAKKDKFLEQTINNIKESCLEEDIVLTVDILPKNEIKKMAIGKEPLISSIIKNHKDLYGKRFIEVIQ